MGKVVVVGSSNTDMVVKVPRLPGAGETVLGGLFVEAAGGKGANQAVAAARSGAAVTFIAKVGADSLGERAIAGFRSDGIDVSWIARDTESASGVALIMVDDQGQNCIAVASGANGRLAPCDLEAAEDAFGGARVVLAQLETPLPTVCRAAEMARDVGALFLLNPAPAQAIPASLMQLVDVLIPNEVEAEGLTGIAVVDEWSARKAAETLVDSGAGAVVVTLGKRGAYLLAGSHSEPVPGYSVSPVDATAAGDAFCGALASALSDGDTLPVAVQYANAVAAVSVTRLGAQPSMPSRLEVKEWLDSLGPLGVRR